MREPIAMAAASSLAEMTREPEDSRAMELVRAASLVANWRFAI
jgi:hypothetical protein